MFRALDGGDFHFDGDECHVEVYGVHNDGHHWWLQLALDGDRPQMLTLQLGPSDCPDCVLISSATHN